MNGRVGIYRAIYPLPSETFIVEQCAALKSFSPYLLIRRRVGEVTFPMHSLCTNNSHTLRDLAYSITGQPSIFGVSDLPNLDLIHAHFGPDGVYGMRLAKALKIPLIVTFHGFDVMTSKSQMLLSGMPSVYLYLALRKLMFTYAFKLIAVSDFIKKNMIRQGFPSEKIVKHFIGVDVEKFCPVNRLDGERYILSVGRHSEGKGISTLIKAFANIAQQYPDVNLVQIGAGELTDELASVAMMSGVANRIKFLGAQPHQVVRSYMQRAEVFAFPSQALEDGGGVEALGIVLNEASACGVPVVASDIGGIPEAVLDGVTGYLVPQKDHLALAARLSQLLADPNLASDMGRRGRALVCKDFNIRTQSGALEAIYQSALAQ